jgi:hypothetical protein
MGSTSIRTIIGEAFEDVMLEMVFCRSVDNYLGYVADLLAIIFQKQPNALRSDEDNVSHAFILSYSTMEELVAALAERRVSALTYKSLRELHKSLNKQLKFPLLEEGASLDDAVAIVEKRNLFVHNGGRVNSRYKRNVPSSSYQLNEKIRLDRFGLSKDFSVLLKATLQADKRAEEKFNLARNESVLVAQTCNLVERLASKDNPFAIAGAGFGAESTAI